MSAQDVGNAQESVDAKFEGEAGEYPLLIPIDLESALEMHDRLIGLPHLRIEKLAELREDLFLGREVVIQGRFRHAQPPSDFGHCRAAVRS